MSSTLNTARYTPLAPSTPKKTKKVKPSSSKGALISTFLRVKNTKMMVESAEGKLIRG